MATKRTKKTVISGVSRDQYEQAFADFAMADAKAQAIAAKMDQEMTKIREKYADQLAELNETKDRSFEVMQTYATENKDTLFSKKKSLESAHGIIGFRTGNPKLKNMKGFTWAAVTNLCKEFLPQYIRTTEELAKDKLLADRDIPEIAEQFANIGVQVVQDESFYVEPKKKAMRSKQPKYTYERRGPLWIVYRNEYTDTICTGTPVAECRSKEKARDMVYELNGWEKDGKVQN